MGERSSPTRQPSRPRAVFTGMGFTSQNMASQKSFKYSWSFPASAKSLSKHSRARVCISAGRTLATTEMTPTPQGADGHRLIVVAGPDVKVLQAQVPGPLDVPQVSGGLLGAGDVWVLRQLRVSLRRDRDPGAGGHIVEDAGNIHRISNGSVVLNQPGLGGLVVVWRHQQQPVSPGLFRLLREGDGH